MCLSEIWHQDNKKNGKVYEKWNWIASERKEREGGGVGIILSKQLKFIHKKDLWSKNYEAVWCNVYTDEHRFLIASVYIPPDSKKSELFSICIG